MATNPHLKLNVLKNGIVLIISVAMYPFILGSLAQITVEQTNDILLMISMLLVTVCFANFAFTYGQSKMHSIKGKLLAHSATGIFLLLTALFLESIIIIVNLVYPSFYFLMLVFSILLYGGVVLYYFFYITKV